jgi:hypothetical protein
MIPQTSLTRIAAVTLPEELRGNPRFTPTSAPYAKAIFAKAGKPFDVRICIDRFPSDGLISNSGVFEHLDFSNYIEHGFQIQLDLSIQRDAILDGLLLWLCLYVDPGEYLDVLSGRFNWLPVFLPVFYPGIRVSAGDSIHINGACSYSNNTRYPDYRFDGILVRRDADPLPFSYVSAYLDTNYKATPFYRELLDSLERASVADSGHNFVRLDRDLRGHLAGCLPGHMVPSEFVFLKALPRNHNGKMNRTALAALRAARRHESPPATDLERTIASVFAGVLNKESFGRDTDFFTVGGHSLLATRAASQLRDILQADIPLRSLFEHPTPAGLAEEIARAGMISRGRMMPGSAGPQPGMGEDQISDSDVDLLLERMLTQGEVL